MEAPEEDKLPEEEIIAQISTLIFAGTDTTSNALARITHLLCLHQDVQDKLRAEIAEAYNANEGLDLEYDDLVELQFLDAVCRETLRLFPPAPFVARQAQHDTTLPLSATMNCVDDTLITSIPVPKGTPVITSIYSCNRNKALWNDDAETCRPDRWLEGEGKVLKSAGDVKVPGVYSNLMTFLGGGRACIGVNFAQLGMKVVLAVLLKSFHFSLLYGAKEKIVWIRVGVVYPMVGWESKKPSMPLGVEAVNM